MKAEFMKRRFIISVLILGMVGFGIAFGGDVIVKEGSEYIANKLGIGTTSPTVALDIDDGEVLVTGSDSTTGDGPDVLVVTGGKGKDETTTQTGGKGSDISISSGEAGTSGYVDGADGGDILIATGDGGDGGAPWGGYKAGDSGNIQIVTGTGGDALGDSDGGDSGDIELTTGTPGSGASSGDYGNILLAKNGGNVGIGTDSPSETLDVDGTVKMTGLIIPSGTTPAPNTEGALFLDTDAGANGTLKIYSNGAWRTVAAL